MPLDLVQRGSRWQVARNGRPIPGEVFPSRNVAMLRMRELRGQSRAFVIPLEVEAPPPPVEAPVRSMPMQGAQLEAARARMAHARAMKVAKRAAAEEV